jgi:ornithine carbamoyltransferase
MKGRDFLSIDDLTVEELRSILDDAAAAKATPANFGDRLSGKQIALIFEKPSTRTRVSFETAVSTMGGHAIVLRGDELQLGRGETIEDTGTVMSRYVDAIVIRTFGQDRLERLAAAAEVPVVNALSDHEHPCQALADLQTIIEHRGDPAGKIVTYIGDGNNVANSLMLGAVMLGAHMRVATPADYEPVETVVMRCEQIGQSTGGSVEVVHDPHRAAEGANVLYTDVWASMGQEAEASEKKKVFSDYQIDSEVLAKAAPDAIVLHCLPAHRGEEISANVIDGPQSVVWDEAENRMHAQKALLGQILA